MLLVRVISRCKLPHTFFYSGRKKLVQSYPIHFSIVGEKFTLAGLLSELRPGHANIRGHFLLSRFWGAVEVTPLFHSSDPSDQESLKNDANTSPICDVVVSPRLH